MAEHVLISAFSLLPEEAESSENHIDIEFRGMARKLSLFCDNLLQVGCNTDIDGEKRKKR